MRALDLRPRQDLALIRCAWTQPAHAGGPVYRCAGLVTTPQSPLIREAAALALVAARCAAVREHVLLPHPACTVQARCLCMAGSSRSRAEPAVGLRVELSEDTEVGWLEVGKVGRRSAEDREIHPPSQRTGPLSYPALYDGGGSRCSTWKAVDADRGRDEQGSAQSGILGAVGSGTVGMCGVRDRGRVAANGPSSQRPQPAELARSWLGQQQLRIAYRHAAAHAHHRQPEPRTPVRP